MITSFHLDKSFIATLYWHETASTLRRIGIGHDGTTPLTHNDGWLFAGKPNTDWKLPSTVKVNFWFGCYRAGDRYVYELRGLLADKPFFRSKVHNRRLDVSRNGYLGLYGVPFDTGVAPSRFDGIPVWTLSGFGPGAAQVGQRISNITLLSPSGKTVKRLVEQEFPYLNDQQGTAAQVALDIVSVRALPPH